MLERLEKIFREMNRAPGLDAVFRAALLGLEDVITGCRARVVPQSYELTHRIESCGLESRFVLIEREQDKVLQEARDFGRAIVDSRGVDPTRIQCCVVPFRGGLLYLDSREPFPAETASVVGMVCHQLVANLGGADFSLVKSERDTLKQLPNETWFNNRLHEYDKFAVISVEIDGFEKFKSLRGWEVAESALRELVAFFAQRLKTRDLLARCHPGEFLILTEPEERRQLTAVWQQMLREFEAHGIARLHNLTLSAGLALFPEDGHHFAVKELAQAACARATRAGRRVMAVASRSHAELSLEDEARDRFDARCRAVIEAAIRECQVWKRSIDPLSLLSGFMREEAELAKPLWKCGLHSVRFQERLESGPEGPVEFMESTRKVFSFSLELAHRGGRASAGPGELLVACLIQDEVETILRDCGLAYGRLLAELYRTGDILESDTFLVGDFGEPKRGLPLSRGLRKRPTLKQLGASFGERFSADVWALLASAREEARHARHHLEFVHLYIAVLRREEVPLEAAREALMGLALEQVSPEFSTPQAEVLEFFRVLDLEFQEVTVENFRARLIQQPTVREFIKRIKER